jgi:hypothetical protein
MKRLHLSLIRKRTALLQLLLLLLTSLLGLVPLSLGATFVVRVQPNEEECFMIRTGSYDPGRPRFLEGGFEVIDDYSTESILVILMDEKEHAVYQRTNERHDYFFVENVAPNTHYWLCLQSHPSPDATDDGAKSERIIGFEFELVFDEDDYPTLPPRPGPIQVEPYTKIWMQKVSRAVCCAALLLLPLDVRWLPTELLQSPLTRHDSSIRRPMPCITT